MTSTEELAELLRRVGLELDARQRETRQRSLSFQDALFDRFDRARRLGFGEGSSIYNSTQVFGDVTAGRNVFVGAFGILDGQYAKITIGDYVSLSAGVHIYSHDTMLWSLSGGAAEKRTGPVAIGERCYVGSQSIVACGVTVGSQSVIGCNSFVNDDVPPRTIVAGSPARRVGEVQIDNGTIKLAYD